MNRILEIHLHASLERGNHNRTEMEVYVGY